MFRRFFSFFSLLAFILGFPLGSPFTGSLGFTSLTAQEMAFRPLLVAKIEVRTKEGSTPIDRQAVLGRMKTKEGEPFSHLDFDQDIKTLAKDFDRVDPKIEMKEDQVWIILHIAPKPYIHSIIWQGAEKIKQSRLAKELKIDSGALFDRQSFNKGFNAARSYYVKKGFFEAQLNYQLQPVAGKDAVDIIIDVKEGRSGKIKKIVFKNFSRQEEHDLLDLMMTKSWNSLTGWLGDEGTYRRELVQHDQLVVLNYLQNQGYADAQVDVAIAPAKESNRILLEVSAEKGERYHFGSVTVEGNQLLSDSEILQRLKIHDGDLYSPEKLREATQSLSDFYGRKGYIDALVTYDLKLSMDKPCYNVHIKVEEGQTYRVGIIRVFGNRRTKPSVILHECFLIPGEIFDMEKLSKTEERLALTDYFSHVNVYAVNSAQGDSDKNRFRDVHIEVEEKGTGNFVAFSGFSTLERVFGGIKLIENNFNYRGITRVLDDGLVALRGGGEYLNFSASIGQRGSDYVLGWGKPFFRDTPWHFGFDLEKGSSRYYSHGDYEVRSFGGRVHGSYPLNQFVRFRAHYRIKNTRTYSNVKQTSAAERLTLDEELQNLIDQRGVLAAYGGGLTYDSRDHPTEPKKGFYSLLEGEVSAPFGNYKFGSIQYSNTYYHSVSQNQVLKLRLDARVLLTFDSSNRTLPVDERFFLGGEGSVRGYAPGAIGDRFIGRLKKAGSSEYVDQGPKGGRSALFFSAEYDWRVFKRFHLFTFIDGGSLSSREWRVGEVLFSTGLGCRIRIFPHAPPLTLGWGFPLKNNKGQKASEGRKEKKESFFFSLGASF